MPLAIVGWGEGGAGLVHAWIEEAAGVRVRFFIHPADEAPNLDPARVLADRPARQFDFPHDGRFKGVEFFAAADWPARVLAAGVRHALVIVADNATRRREAERGAAAGLTMINAIHPTATVMPDAILGRNVILFARAFVGYRAEIDDGVLINTGAQIDHHSVVRAGAHIGPGVVCAGGVLIGRDADVNLAAVLTKRIRIGDGAVVAAGAVVLRDVEAGALVMGVPARPAPRRELT